jgi:hypothetical protein
VGQQSLYIRISDVVARRLNLLLDQPDSGYSSIDEFAEVAIRNQLNVENAPAGPSGDIDKGSRLGLMRKPKGKRVDELPIGVAVDLTRPIELFRRPTGAASLPFAVPADSPEQRLSPLTNRLSQLKVSARVCANLSEGGTWPDLKVFQSKAAATARAVGIVLRGEVVQVGGDGDAPNRAHIGYPVGGDPEKAQARFINSFTITVVGEKVTGPLAILGLANIVDGRVSLTEAGWRFAALPSPLAQETTDGVLLGSEEAAELRARLLEAPAELTMVREFLHDVRRADGSQTKVDQMLNREYPEWNQGVVIAQRAAMVGRLSDINVLEVDGRGANALIRLLPAAQEFLTASTELTHA